MWEFALIRVVVQFGAAIVVVIVGVRDVVKSGDAIYMA